MTILVYDAKTKTVYSDRCCTFGPASHQTCKPTFYKGKWILVSGDATAGIRAAKRFIDEPESVNWSAERGFKLMVLDPTEQSIKALVKTQNKAYWEDTTGGSRTMGNGAEAYQTALAVGMSTLDALRFTINNELFCSFNIDSLTLDGVLTECLF